jgi:hypothetical protein
VDSPQPAAIPFSVQGFPKTETLEAVAAAEADSRYAAWQESIRLLANDPSTACIFPFWKEDELPLNAAVAGVKWSEGRWETKAALEFHSRSARLKFQVPEALPALTLLACVRVDALSNDYNSLLLPTRYSAGSLHWTLERGGELRLTMLTNPIEPLTTGRWDGPVSALAVTSMDLGRWISLATTYEAATGQVVHYRDGQEVGQGVFSRKLLAKLGDVEFGNWGADGTHPDNAWISQQLRHQRQRNFTGRLDFLTVVRRVLSKPELRALMLP